MANEVVKHHNDLNTVIMRKWTAEEMNFFFAIIAKARDKGTSDLVFDKYQLAELANYSIQHNKRFYDTMDSLANNISQLRYIEKTSKSIEYMPLFTRFRVDWEENLSDMQAQVSVSPHFEYILNKLSANFTQYELQEFTTIRSTYAKTAYRLLKQWRTVGRKEFKIDEFKLLLDMPVSYKSCHIDRLVLKPILEQLSPYFEDLKVKKIKSKKRGNPVLAYEFTWEKEVAGTYDPDKFNKPKSEPKKANKSKSSKKTNVPEWTEPDYKNMTTDEEKAKLKSYQKARLEGDEEEANRLREEVEEGLKRLDNAKPYKK
ncbi:replication protein [Streptococcus oralis]|uniref:Replication protein n=1 Tax=Streptococcus oralis TaxID=1303 RepID=A0A139PI59_STROR|nr:replication protein [Streptococcus oralis]